MRDETNIAPGVLPTQALLPGNQIKEWKRLFDSEFKKETWVINPSTIPFLMPIEVREAKENVDQTVTRGLLPLMAPVNHNKLTPAKMYQLLHTILGNPYQDNNETT